MHYTHLHIYLIYLLFRNGSRVRLSPWAKPRWRKTMLRLPCPRLRLWRPFSGRPRPHPWGEDRAEIEEGDPAQAVPVHARDPADLALAAPVHAHEEGDPAQAAPVDALQEEGEEEDPINVQTAPVHTHEGEGPAQAAPVNSHAAIMAEIEMHWTVSTPLNVNKVFYIHDIFVYLSRTKIYMKFRSRYEISKKDFNLIHGPLWNRMNIVWKPLFFLFLPFFSIWTRKSQKKVWCHEMKILGKVHFWWMMKNFSQIGWRV